MFDRTLILFVATGVVRASSHVNRSRGVDIGGNSLDPVSFYETSLLHSDFAVELGPSTHFVKVTSFGGHGENTSNNEYHLSNFNIFNLYCYLFHGLRQPPIDHC